MPIGRLTTWSESKSTHNFYIICSTFVLQMLQKSTLIILTNAFFSLEEIFCLGSARGLGPLGCALQTPLTPPALRHRWQPGPANTPPRKYHRQGSFTKYKRTVAPKIDNNICLSCKLYLSLRQLASFARKENMIVCTSFPGFRCTLRINPKYKSI